MDFDGSHNHSVSGTTGSDSHTHTALSAGEHTHTFSSTTGSSGSGSAFDNTQPWMALDYIIKLDA
jgi:microcystin-dependent protein